MKLIIFILIVFSSLCFSQIETHRWKANTVKYTVFSHKKSSVRHYKGFFGLLQKSYKLLISDYDGDNCPFYPSCSQFFVEAVRKTNLFEGFLMFADRFTRDLNYFNRVNYHRKQSGKLYDLPEKYILW